MTREQIDRAFWLDPQHLERTISRVGKVGVSIWWEWSVDQRGRLWRRGTLYGQVEVLFVIRLSDEFGQALHDRGDAVIGDWFTLNHRCGVDLFDDVVRRTFAQGEGDRFARLTRHLVCGDRDCDCGRRDI